MGSRFVTVWWSDWPVVAAGATAGAAIVLHANRVVARSPVAAAEGVAIGQRRRVAQQCCPGAVLLDHDPARDARRFEPVVGAVAAFTPRVEQVEPGWLCLDARGPSRYFGGDAALPEQVTAAVTAAGTAAGAAPGGPPVGVGIADGRFASANAARLAAERGRPVVVAPGDTPAFLAPLPVAWLHQLGEADAELVGLLARMGLARLGDVAALAAGDVLGRFGPLGHHVHRLASGRDARPPGGAEPPPERRVERSFDDPVTDLAPLVFVVKQLADELVSVLRAEGRVCTRLAVVAETEHGERSERVWYRAAGLSAPAMVERVRWQLDGWIATDITAGVVLVGLSPEEVRGDDGDQLGFWGGRSAADERATRAVTRLVGLVGDDAVLVPAWRGGRLPGDRYAWVPASTTDLADPDDTAERIRPRLDEPWPGALPAPSPSVVLPAARPAELLDAAGQPVRVSGRGELSAAPATLRIGDGPAAAVRSWAGPWPLEERWWDPHRSRRVARFQIVTSDGGAHLVLAEHRRWWIAAAYE
jgi:protein ImuB